MGAGGGVLRAFTGKSAAKTEPVIAISVANTTNFFIESPIPVEPASERQDASRIKPGGNLVWYFQFTKQKM